MAVQLETTENINARAEKAMALAQQITKDSCLATGVTDEEYDRGLREVDVFESLLGKGYSEERANALMDAMTPEEIQSKHREMYPGQYTYLYKEE